MYGVPYQKHSAPSREAAAALKPETVEKQVYDVIKAAGSFGATDEEIWYALFGVKESTVRARRVRLCELNKVVPATESGDTSWRPLVRKTKSGRNAQVWVAA